MERDMRSMRKAGFTLIEVLVTVVVIGVLAAVVIPAVTAQVTAGDSSRVIADLNNLRTGIENFDIAVRQFPGDIDDLVNAPSNSSTGSGVNSDADVTGAIYLGASSWAGPYSEASLPSSVTSSTASIGSAAFTTGYAGTINNKLQLCRITDTNTACDSSSPDYVTIEVDNLTQSQTASLNQLIDGVNEAASSTSGKFRTVLSGTTIAYYFATPFK
jgi:prepilin-type N-terminal cleavage/methylation domain-containing protein